MRRFLIWWRQRKAEASQRKAEASRDRAAIERAIRYFRATHNLEPMGAHVVRRDVNEVVVRVMYLTDHIPPDRAWFVVSDHQGAVREVSLAEAGDTAVWR